VRRLRAYLRGVASIGEGMASLLDFGGTLGPRPEDLPWHGMTEAEKAALRQRDADARLGGNHGTTRDLVAK
jgi:hypothetical protein